MTPHTLVLASGNKGKLVEFRGLLSRAPVRLLPMDAVLRTPLTLIEDGKTFEENAIKKARAVADATMMLTLADDSGLEVDALGGRPGVRSARFASERATDAENNAALLAAIEALGDPTTGGAPGTLPARFSCALALVDPYAGAADPIVATGSCEGTVIRSARGTAGFGYDPLFEVKDRGKTMAELGEAEKNAISHRARAVEALLPLLLDLLAARDREVRRISRF